MTGPADDPDVVEYAGGAVSIRRPATVFDDGRALLSVGERDSGCVLAVPGDVMTCPDGHPVLRIVETIQAQAIAPQPSAFRLLDRDEAPPTGVLPPCPTCGCEVCPGILTREGRWNGRYALFVNGQPARARPAPEVA